jgi:thioesterase domain-containing protein
MKALRELEARILGHIPLTRHLDFRLRHWVDGSLEVTASLAANINDKGTLFAGSQAALMALSGWALTTLEAEAEGGRCDVMAVKSSLHHRAPAPGDALIRVRAPADSLDSFHRRLSSRGWARLMVAAELLGAEQQVLTEYEAGYLASRLD